MQEGWKCPECGKVKAPWVQECDHVALEQAGSTYWAPLQSYMPYQQPGYTTLSPMPSQWPITVCDSTMTASSGRH